MQINDISISLPKITAASAVIALMDAVFYLGIGSPRLELYTTELNNLIRRVLTRNGRSKEDRKISTGIKLMLTTLQENYYKFLKTIWISSLSLLANLMKVSSQFLLTAPVNVDWLLFALS